MKFVLMFVGTKEDQDRWDAQSPAELERAMGGAGAWFEKYTKSGNITGGAQLEGYKGVTTVRGENGTKLVTDGPFIESKEVIGGLAIVTAKDLAEAQQMAKEWPGGPVEIWPAVEQSRA